MTTRTWDENRSVINQLWPTYTFTDEERRLWHDDLSGKDQAVLYDAIRNAKRSHETPWPQVKWIHDAYRELDLARRAVTRQQRAKEPKLDLRIVESEDRRLADEFIAMIDLASPSDFEQIEHHVLDKLPKSVQPRAKAALHEMMNAPTKAECERLTTAFAGEYEAKYPKAAKALTDDLDKLTTHFDLPAEHWKHLRTTNPIESTFATVKLRQRVTKGAGSRNAGLAMAYRLLLLAEGGWRKLDAASLLPLVRAGVWFKDGVRIERDDAKVEVTDIKKRTQIPKSQKRKVAA